MELPTNIQDAIELRRWRRRAGLSRARAAADLGISERMLAYYETAEHKTPRSVLLATRALAAGLGDACDFPRDRWVALVRNLLDYGQGEPVVGRMLRERDRDGLRDFLAFVRRGPDPDLALTDSALFQSLRAAVTRAQLGGLAQFRIDYDRRPADIVAAAE
jgi:transcriptional regulator with XRE-family HTH domain